MSLPPQQTTDLSASAEGLKVAVGLLFLIRYGICSLLSKQNNSTTVTGWGRLKYLKPFKVGSLKSWAPPSCASQVLEGQICIQRGSSSFPEERQHNSTWRENPEMSKMLRQEEHPTQAIFHNHREVLTPPPAQESAARAQQLHPHPTLLQLLGGSRVPSPFPLTGHVTSYGQPHGDSQHWAQFAKQWATKVSEG